MTYDDFLTELRSISDWEHLTVHFKVQIHEELQQWSHNQVKWFFDSGLQLDKIIEGLVDLSEGYPNTAAFLFNEDEGRPLLEIFDEWRFGWPQAAFIFAQLEDRYSESSWIIAMFEDDDEGRKAAMLFKLALD